MSGYRPFREFRTASEMKKAIIRGLRPNLRKDNINTNLPLIETLMEVCFPCVLFLQNYINPIKSDNKNFGKIG